MELKPYNPARLEIPSALSFSRPTARPMKRGPLKRLVPIEQTLSEITGPLLAILGGGAGRERSHAQRQYRKRGDGGAVDYRRPGFGRK